MPRAKGKHDQRGRSLGTCPDCGREMWAQQRTVNVPIRVNGRLRGVLLHVECADTDRA